MKASIEICFPRAARQRCLAHRMRNLAAKVPEDVWPDFKVRAQAAYQAPSRAIARELAAGVKIKHDGFRVVARKDGVARVRLYSRPGMTRPTP